MGKVATRREVLQFYTDLLRNGPLPHSIKGAEFFVKYYNLVNIEDEDENKVVIVDDIARAEAFIAKCLAEKEN